jgi:hypothetical protein
MATTVSGRPLFTARMNSRPFATTRSSPPTLPVPTCSPKTRTAEAPPIPGRASLDDSTLVTMPRPRRSQDDSADLTVARTLPGLAAGDAPDRCTDDRRRQRSTRRRGQSIHVSLAFAVHGWRSGGVIFVEHIPVRSARVIQDMCRLKPDETAVPAHQGECLCAAVDGRTAADVVERHAFVPAFPVPTAAEGALESRATAAKEREYRSLRAHAP